MVAYHAPTWDDVRRLALSLPETSETLRPRALGRGRLEGQGQVRSPGCGRCAKSDLAALAALGVQAPQGEILGARVEHEGAKLALIESEPEIYFTTPHFDGYAAVLVRLDVIGARCARGAARRRLAGTGAEAARPPHI